MRTSRGRLGRFVNRGGRLYAVIDDADAAARAVAALIESGVAADRIELQRAEAAPGNLDEAPAGKPFRGRLRRAVEFMLMDQAPDIAWYEAALRSGRAVVGVRASREADVRRAADILRRFGGHFINHFGWFTTEELERWHGTEPNLPDYLRR
jgi:hypothetical protein